MNEIDIYLGGDAPTKLLEYLNQKNYQKLLLVADGNTWRVLGEKTEKMLTQGGKDVRTVLLGGEEVVPDEQTIFQVLYQAGAEERAYLAVGTGTVTDITRFCAHRTRSPFISLPTAPSVDGFTSPSCSLSIKRVKTTVTAKPPEAIFADLDVLCAAPQKMIAAGFGDILGKSIALADWHLGRLLWDEPFSEEVAQKVRRTLDGVVADAASIGRAEPEAVGALMQGLGDSGLCMLAVGSSRPAAGIEHYMSHFLEMKLLREGRPAILHGAKVALCAVYAARQYAQVRSLSKAEAEAALAKSTLPDPDEEIRIIRMAYPDIAEKVIAEMNPFLSLTSDQYEALKGKIAGNWEAVQQICAEVPEADTLSRLIRESGGADTPEALGLTREELDQAMEWAHFFRNRFSISKLARILGLAN